MIEGNYKVSITNRDGSISQETGEFVVDSIDTGELKDGEDVYIDESGELTTKTPATETIRNVLIRIDGYSHYPVDVLNDEGTDTTIESYDKICLDGDFTSQDLIDIATAMRAEFDRQKGTTNVPTRP